MKHTEAQIKAMAIKIMDDLEIDYYFKDQVYIKFHGKYKLLWGGEVSNCWTVALIIPSHRGPDGDGISLYIDDATGRVYNYKEGPGRPVPATVKLNDAGKYEIAGLDI